MFEGPSKATKSETREEQEGIPPEMKAAAALTMGVLWGVLRSTGELQELDWNKKDTEMIEKEGWATAILQKTERAYSHIGTIERLFKGR